MSLAARPHSFISGNVRHCVMIPYSEHMRSKSEYGSYVPARPLSFPTIGVAETLRTTQSVVLPSESYSSWVERVGPSTLDQSEDLNLSSTKGQESSIDDKSQSQDEEDYRQNGNKDKGLKAPWTPEV